jgi:hypothetical protein
MATTLVGEGPDVASVDILVAATVSYGTSPVNRSSRHRATKAEMAERHGRIADIVITGGPMSVRHAYYRAVVEGLVEKRDSGYRKVQAAVLRLRRERRIPYDLVVDTTRWMRKPQTFASLEDVLRTTARTYRRNLWLDSDWRLEVWCESESIAGVVHDVTWEWDVPLMPCKGFTSETFAYGAAEAWATDGRTPVVLYVGDFDPHGLEIENALRNRLAEFYGDDFLWTRLGITLDQVVALGLWDTGTEPKKDYGYPLAWEAEAIPAEHLRQLVDEAIEGYADPRRLETLRQAEASEREILLSMVGRAAP